MLNNYNYQCLHDSDRIGCAYHSGLNNPLATRARASCTFNILLHPETTSGMTWPIWFKR